MSYLDNYYRGKDGRPKSRDTNDGFGGMLSDFGYSAGKENAARRARADDGHNRLMQEEGMRQREREHDAQMSVNFYKNAKGQWVNKETGVPIDLTKPKRPVPLANKIVAGILLTFLILFVVGMIAYAIISSMPPER